MPIFAMAARSSVESFQKRGDVHIQYLVLMTSRTRHVQHYKSCQLVHLIYIYTDRILEYFQIHCPASAISNEINSCMSCKYLIAVFL